MSDLGKLLSSFDVFIGARVEAVLVMPAELTRRVDQYAVFRLRKGNETYRVMLVAQVVERAGPRDTEMLETILEGSEFFTLQEVSDRQKKLPLLRDRPLRKIDVDNEAGQTDG